MKPIIFLEIDGVLTTQKGTDEAMKRMGDIFDQDGREYFCPKAVEALNKITNATDADIVVISNWRKTMSLGGMQELFSSRRITGNIIGYTPVTGDTNSDIEAWMEEHGKPKAYVIIDDEAEIQSLNEVFPDDRCVGTQFIHGLAMKSCYKRSINYLNRVDRVKKEVASTSKKLF